MMSVYEYASDMNKTVSEILNLCKNLGIKVNGEDDLLSDDDIILLDNEIDNTESVNEMEEAVDDDNLDHFEENYSEVEEIKVVATGKKKKKNPKKEDKNKNSNEDFAKQKKEMYKHKDKLISNINTLDDSIVLYTEGMSV